MSAQTILTIVDDATHANSAALLGRLLPAVQVERVQPEHLRRLPAAIGLIVADAASARIARATGFTGGIIVTASPKSDDQRAAFREQGTEFVGAELSPTSLKTALDTAIPRSPDGGFPAVDPSVAQARQVLAASEIAFTLQHDLNNPLSALLAEVQLLQMEAPTEEVQQTAGRLLELVRRLTTLTKSLDGVRSPKLYG